VAISEKVASSAVASVKADCATVAKVEAGVTVRSMIPTIKAECLASLKQSSGAEMTSRSSLRLKRAEERQHYAEGRDGRAEERQYDTKGQP
jgi:hypothetical protein